MSKFSEMLESRTRAYGEKYWTDNDEVFHAISFYRLLPKEAKEDHTSAEIAAMYELRASRIGHKVRNIDRYATYPFPREGKARTYFMEGAIRSLSQDKEYKINPRDYIRHRDARSEVFRG